MSKKCCNSKPRCKDCPKRKRAGLALVAVSKGLVQSDLAMSASSGGRAFVCQPKL